MRWEDHGAERWIHLTGDLDHRGCEEIEKSFTQALAQTRNGVVVRMDEVTFVGSQGIRMLLHAHHQLREDGRELRLSGMNHRIRRVLETVGVFRVIPEWKP